MPVWHNISSIFKSPFAHAFLVLALGVLAYSNTFQVPFFLDEYFITDNPFVRDIRYPVELIKNINLDIYNNIHHRYVAFLTFALNYRLHGLDVFGYHLVNVSLHLMNALLVYALVALTLRTPLLESSSLNEKRFRLALFSALIFVAHPVLTEAVTWIWQRVAVLVATFYLASVIAYVRARLEKDKGWKKYALYGISLFCSVLAMKTKQNAFTLPVMITLYEFTFFSGDIVPRLKRLIPFAITLLIIPYTYFIEMGFSPSQATRGIGTAAQIDISRWDYVLTQFSTLVTYIRVLLVPVNLPVYHAFSVNHSFFDAKVLLSFSLLAILLGTSVFLLLRRDRQCELALIAFGIIWFFTAHLVESGLIPLNVVIAKHRNYLPSVGFFIAIVSAVSLLTDRIKNTRVLQALSFLIVFILAVSCYARNAVWGTAVTLGEDVVKNAPDNSEAHLILGRAYKRENRLAEAQREFEESFRLDAEKNSQSSGSVTGGMPAERRSLPRETLKPGEVDAHFNIAIGHYQSRSFDDAMSELKAVLAAAPRHAGAFYFTGLIHHEQGNYEEAAQAYREALRLQPDHVEARTNLGGVYAQVGRFKEAAEEIKSALRIRPDNAESHKFLGLIYQDIGQLHESLQELTTAIKLKPDYAEAHNNLGEVYAQMGRTKDAAEEFNIALKLKPDLVGARKNLEKITEKH